MDKKEMYFLDVSKYGVDVLKLADIEDCPEDYVYSADDEHKLYRVESMTEVRVKSHTIIEVVAPPPHNSDCCKSKVS